MSKAYDIVIVGAGLVGSTLALWLAKHTDYRIAIVERGAPLKKNTSPNQRVVALGQIACDLLRDVGVFSELGLSHAYPYRHMRVWDENSNGELAFHASDTDHEQLGWMVDSQLCTALLQAKLFETEQIDPIFDCLPETLTLDNDAAELVTQGGGLQAKLLIAADGSRSWVRQQAKIFANHQSYQQQGVVARIRTELSHQDCAWQRFLSTGPIAILPLNNNESSIVWSADTQTSQTLRELNDEEFCSALSKALDGRLGEVALLSDRQTFPLQSVRASHYYRRNLVLIGDAAHSIHPLAGQGANLGFKDVLCLGPLLKAATASELGAPSLLARFEGARKPDNEQTDALMTALYSVYRDTSAISTVVRGFGMNWLNRSTMLRTLLVSQATGA